MKRQRDKASDLKFILKGIFIYMPASLFVLIGSFMLQYVYLDPSPSFRAVTGATARAGYVIVIAAVTVLVLDLAAIVTYMIRQGAKDDSEGSVIEEGPLPMDLDMGVGGPSERHSSNETISFLWSRW